MQQGLGPTTTLLAFYRKAPQPFRARCTRKLERERRRSL
jgi:hypothetical protein